MAQARKVGKKAVPRRTAKKQKHLPGWAWMLIGLLVGAIFTVTIFMFQNSKEIPVAPAPKKEPAIKIEKKAPVKTETEKDKKSLLNFDFYHILPEMEVMIPESELEYEQVQQKVHYILQVGSFKTRKDAEGRLTELLLLNFEPTIQTVTIDGDNTWHRVRIGPFSNHLALDKARRLLQDNDIAHIVLKERE